VKRDGLPIGMECVIQVFATGIWYTKPEGVRRFTWWFCGTGLGQIMGGLVSWVTQIALVLMVVFSMRRLFIIELSASHWRIPCGMAYDVHHAWHPDNYDRSTYYHRDARRSDVCKLALGGRKNCCDTSGCGKPNRHTE
jgi:hypothetical protein